jgi:hypothetical protein
MYDDQGQQITGLITEDEVKKVEHYESINERDFF